MVTFVFVELNVNIFTSAVFAYNKLSSMKVLVIVKSSVVNEQLSKYNKLPVIVLLCTVIDVIPQKSATELST